MGAKFALSIANLYMAKWEEDSVISTNTSEITLYRRFIDDLILIWEGDQENLQNVKHNMNQNDRNIKLSWESSTEHIQFLDLDIIQREVGSTQKHFFKSTDHNSYIYQVNSCHFKPWLINRGQFKCIKRNCS